MRFRVILVAYRGLKLHIHVALDDADRIAGLRLEDTQFVDLLVVLDGYDIALREAGKVAQRILQHRLGIGDVQEVGAVRLEFGEGGHRQGYTLDVQDVALLQQQIVHHPVGQIAFALVGHELKDAGVGGSGFLAVGKLEEHWVFHVQTGQRVQCGWGHNNCGL